MRKDNHIFQSEKILYISTLLIIFHDAEIHINYFIFRELTKKMTTTLSNGQLSKKLVMLIIRVSVTADMMMFVSSITFIPYFPRVENLQSNLLCFFK